MFECGKNKLWIENPRNLVNSVSIIPMIGMTVEQQMNAITRFVILTFIILVLFNFKYSVIFLLISFLLIIILYYIQRMTSRSNSIECFTEQEIKSTNISEGRKKIQNKSLIFCPDSELTENNFNNPEYVSRNQKLAGPPNPKTLIAPVIVPPPTELSHWRANNLVTHSAINDSLQEPLYQSGYLVNAECKQQEPYVERDPLDFLGDEEEEIRENMEMPYVKQLPKCPQKVQIIQNGEPLVEGYQDFNREEINRSGLVNTACGYDPDQLQYGLPSNLVSSNCNRNADMKKLNSNIYRQTIQPGVYNTSEVNEQLNSNLGISFTQQFPPVTHEKTDEGVFYTERDPNFFKGDERKNISYNHATEWNVYDPRHNGYGTGYRSYTDEMLGQNKFYYDDIDSVRMPNYIVRSNIDNHSFADRYGTVSGSNQSGNSLNNIRNLAENAFMNDSINHRNDLQHNYARKMGRKLAQRRQAPLGPHRI